MKEKRVNKFDPLPPNFDMLDYDMKVKCEKAVYKRQSHGRFAYHLGDPRLKSGDKAREIYGKEDD